LLEYISGVNDTIIDIYSYILGDEGTCDTSGNEFHVNENEHSFKK